MSALAAKQSQLGPKNNIGQPGIGANPPNAGIGNSPDRLALEQENGLNAIASKQANLPDLKMVEGSTHPKGL